MSTDTASPSTTGDGTSGTDATAAEPVDTEEASVEMDESNEIVEVDHAPSRLSQVLTIVAAIIGVGSTAPFSGFAVPFGLVGLVLLGIGIGKVYSSGWVSIGVAMILIGTLISGVYGFVPPELMLLGVSATFVAWDIGQYGLSIGEQLGRQTRSSRLETVHVASTTVFMGVVSVLTYSIYMIGDTGQPAPAVTLALVGAILVLWTVRS